MNKKQFKKLLRMIYDKKGEEHQRNLNKKLLLDLSLETIIKENHEHYEYVSDYESIDDDIHSIIYNANDIILNESFYLDKIDRKGSTNLNNGDNSVNDSVLIEKQASNHDNNIDDSLDVFFQATEPKEGIPLLELWSWFPVFVNGVCRFMGKVQSEHSLKMVGTVTEAVLDYNASVITTNNSRYKLTGDMDTTYLPTNTTDTFPTLSQHCWLKNSMILSKLAKFGKKSLINSKVSNLGHQKRINLQINQLSTTKPYMILSTKKQTTTDPGDTVIRSHLDDIVNRCQSGFDWLSDFKQFLSNYGQNITISEDIFDGETTVNINQLRNVDIDEPDNYDDFLQQGDIFNSTINSSSENLYMWSVVKNSTGKYCITGLVRSDDSYREVLCTQIKSVSSEGTCVLTQREHYLLLGPLYPLAVHCSYPDTHNSQYLDVFVNCFTRGLPKHWKILVTLMDIIYSKCSLLKLDIAKVTAPGLLDMERSPSFESTNEDPEGTAVVDKCTASVKNILRKSTRKAPTRKLIKKPTKGKLLKSMSGDRTARKEKQSNNSETTNITKKVSKPTQKKRLARMSTKVSNSMYNSPNIFLTRPNKFARDLIPDRKSLKIQNRSIEAHCSLIYQPTIGFPVDLSKIPITRSGRMSLPPPDPITFSRFEKVGTKVHFISDSVTKMIFER